MSVLRRASETDEEYAERLGQLDKVWERLMEEQFQLKEYGKLSLFEQNQMTAEERIWWLKRLSRENDERNKRESSISRSGMPLMPNIPSVSTPSVPSIPSVSMPRK